MLSFGEFITLITERFKSEHEPKIRELASKARLDYYIKHAKDKGFTDASSKAPSHRLACFGRCEAVSRAVVKALKPHYPSAKVLNGYYTSPVTSTHQLTTFPGRKRRQEGSHSWVEIPEIKHFVDPTHDQMHHFHFKRETVPLTKQKQFPDLAIKVGHTEGEEYKRKYFSNEWIKKHGA